MRNSLFAAVALLALAGAPSFAAAEQVDASTYNTSGPGVSNQLRPGLAFAPRAHATYRGEPSVATASVDASSFNTAGPGASNSLNGRARPASGFGEPANIRKPGDAQSLVATQKTDSSSYNTSGPGTDSGMNPGLTNAGHARLLAGAIANHS